MVEKQERYREAARIHIFAADTLLLVCSANIPRTEENPCSCCSMMTARLIALLSFSMKCIEVLCCTVHFSPKLVCACCRMTQSDTLASKPLGPCEVSDFPCRSVCSNFVDLTTLNGGHGRHVKAQLEKAVSRSRTWLGIRNITLGQDTQTGREGRTNPSCSLAHTLASLLHFILLTSHLSPNSHPSSLLLLLLESIARTPR